MEWSAFFEKLLKGSSGKKESDENQAHVAKGIQTNESGALVFRAEDYLESPEAMESLRQFRRYLQRKKRELKGS